MPPSGLTGIHRITSTGRRVRRTEKSEPWLEGREGVESVLATVLIIVVTLIASLAVAGYIVGTIGQSQGTAQVAVTGTFLRGADFRASGTAVAFSCGGSQQGSWISLANAGTEISFVTAVTITWAGSSNAFTPSGVCEVGPAGSGSASLYLTFSPNTSIASNAITGQAFAGTVSLSDGVLLLFSSNWQ